MSARHSDLLLSASLLSEEQLVSMVVRGLREAELRDACRALALFGPARACALRDHRAGAQLLAALELGRRACLQERGARTRVRGLADARRIALPVLAEEQGALVCLVLDERMRLVHAIAVGTAAPSFILKRALAAGGARVIIGRRAVGAAVPSSQDVDCALALARAARDIDCALVDWIVIGEDGASSLARLGLIDAGDVRWR